MSFWRSSRVKLLTPILLIAVKANESCSSRKGHTLSIHLSSSSQILATQIQSQKRVPESAPDTYQHRKGRSERVYDYIHRTTREWYVRSNLVQTLLDRLSRWCTRAVLSSDIQTRARKTALLDSKAHVGFCLIILHPNKFRDMRFQ
jgi:hypothetical protein